jgi:hypothetical protein
MATHSPEYASARYDIRLSRLTHAELVALAAEGMRESPAVNRAAEAALAAHVLPQFASDMIVDPDIAQSLLAVLHSTDVFARPALVCKAWAALWDAKARLLEEAQSLDAEVKAAALAELQRLTLTADVGLPRRAEAAVALLQHGEDNWPGVSALTDISDNAAETEGEAEKVYSAILLAGGVPALVQLLSSSTLVRTMQHALYVLKFLVATETDDQARACDAIVTAGGIPPMVALLRDGTELQRRTVCLALRFMTDGPWWSDTARRCCLAIAQAGGTTVIATLIPILPSHLRVFGAEVLGRLAFAVPSVEISDDCLSILLSDRDLDLTGELLVHLATPERSAQLHRMGVIEALKKWASRPMGCTDEYLNEELNAALDRLGVQR